MSLFKVTAIYEYPEVDRSAFIESENETQALLKAIIGQALPVKFQRDEHGCLQPCYWKPEMGGSARWPSIGKNNLLTWGKEKNQEKLRFEITHEKAPTK